MVGMDWVAKLYPVAESQAGYFTRQQAVEVGVDSARLARQVAAGRIMRVAPGVYRLVQFPSSPHEDMMIAWLHTYALEVERQEGRYKRKPADRDELGEPERAEAAPPVQHCRRRNVPTLSVTSPLCAL